MMNPFEFRKMLSPLKKHPEYKLNDILKICYPLKGTWSWDTIDDASEDIKTLFQQVHISSSLIKLGSGGHNIIEWGVNTSYDSPLYKKLYVFMNGEDELSSETEKSLSSTESEKDVEIPPPEKFERDATWIDENPLFNPRLVDDIESGVLQLPCGCDKKDIITIADLVQTMDNDEYVCADGSGEKRKDDGIRELGIYGKPGSIKCAKIISFLKSQIKEYSLNFSVDEIVAKVSARRNIWKWIRVGPGYYRDFEWMLVGTQDVITKTIKNCNTQPLQKRAEEYKDFKLDPSPIWHCEDDECFNIETQSLVKRITCPWIDSYGWTATNYKKYEKNPNKKLQIRLYIHTKFVKNFPEKLIPGKTNKWAENFFSQLYPNGNANEFIDFDTGKDVKYSASASEQYEFSKYGFAKKHSQTHWTLKQLEYLYRTYLKNKKNV